MSTHDDNVAAWLAKNKCASPAEARGEPRPAHSEYLDADFESDEPCWCGIKNPYYAPLPSRCGGYGLIQCHCGGDLCVCHWHGETECFGCEDCEGDDSEEYDQPD